MNIIQQKSTEVWMLLGHTG